MEIFEYLMVMVSIILGLGVTQTLRGLSKIARSPKTYLPVTIWAITLFYLHIQVWWSLWDTVAVVSWTQPFFYLLVAIPCSLFGATELLLPMGNSPDTNWESHFFGVRKWYIGAFCVFAALATLETYVFLGTPLSHPYRINQAIIITAAAAGFFTENRTVHVWTSATVLGSLLIGQALFRLTPGLGD
jgi:hypothetical protein